MSCAGEPLHAELAQRLLKCTDVELWNTYGPTECSIDVTAFRFDAEQKTGPVPIGRPIKGMRVLVLDPVTGSPAAVGAVGELYAGGVGVARGYLNRPDLTAERFVPDPYGKNGWRLYRTGDLVRWREDGNLEYVGRTDDQVKINGVRLEPGEIEAALAAHSNVAGAVVTAKAKADGSTQLVAYVTAVSTEGLRNHLLDRLPETHVPSVFVAVDEFPLTPNGKVDKAALPDPFSRAGREYIAPRTTAEQLVADVWRQLLGVEQISVHDSFFELGGTSLTLTRLANQLRSTAGGEIQLRGLLRATTVEAQANLIASVMADGTQLTAVPRTGALPLSASQRRLWFMEQLESGSSEWVAPTFLRVPMDTPFTTVQKAVDALVARHETLRTRYQVIDGEPTQVIDAPAPVELRVADIKADELAAVLTEEFSTGFDLVEGPVLRALLTRSPREHLLTLAIHHIATDGWSASVLARDFAALLEGEELQPLRDPVRRLRGLAAAHADRRGHRAGARPLADRARRRRPARPADRPHPPAHPRPARRDGDLHDPRRPGHRARQPRPQARLYSVQHPADRVRHRARPVQRDLGRDRRRAGRRSRPRSAGRPGRLLPEHRRTAVQARRGSLLRRLAGTRPRCLRGRVRPLRRCPSTGWSTSWPRTATCPGRRSTRPPSTSTAKASPVPRATSPTWPPSRPRCRSPRPT